MAAVSASLEVSDSETSVDPPLFVWRETPHDAATAVPMAPEQHLPAIWVTAVLVGVAGPFVRTLLIAPAPAPLVVGVLGLLGLVGVRKLPGAPFVRLMLLASTALVAIPFGGRWVAIWLLASLPLAGWVAFDVGPWRHGRSAHGAALPVTVMSVTATFLGRSPTSLAMPIALTCGAWLTAVLYSRFGERLGRLTRQVSRQAATITATVLLTPLWLVTTAVPWLGGRIFRLDPLVAPTNRAGLVTLDRYRPRSRRLWEPTHAQARLSLPYRARRFVAMTALPAIVLVAILTRPAVPLVPQALHTSESAAVADLGWWGEYMDTMDWYFSNGHDLLRFRANADVRSEFLNVSDGRRATWTPPPCRCHRLSVWVYGGSTTFGLGQRDDHTIPSELARIAAREGITLDVSNRGFAGATHWMAAQRFAWDVATEDPPDLVIFYDGVNDQGAVSTLVETGRFGVAEPAARGLELERRNFDEEHGNPPGTPTPDSVVLPAEKDDATPNQPGAAEVGRQTAAHYQRSRSLSVEAAQNAGIPALWFWQPTAASRRPPSPQEESQEVDRVTAQAAAAALPDGVIDLSGSVDASEEAVFYDGAHTNEVGAGLIAAAVYEHIRPQLEHLKREGQ